MSYISEKTNKISIITQIVLNVLSIMFAVAISTFLGSTMPTGMYWIMALLICIVIVSIFYLITYMIADCFEPIKTQISQNNNNIKICEKTNCLCCGILTFKTVKSNYKISPNDDLKMRMKTQYSLFFQDEVLEYEEKNFPDNQGKEIWIVSSSLSTEISDGATDLVGDNLNRGIIYKEFYSITDTQGRDNKIAEENIRLMKKRYTSNNIVFIPYERSNDGISGYLFDILGFVIYIYENERNAYFSIRRAANDSPIYYKMPWCMGERYYDILKSIQDPIQKKGITQKQKNVTKFKNVN